MRKLINAWCSRTGVLKNAANGHPYFRRDTIASECRAGLAHIVLYRLILSMGLRPIL